MSKICAILNYTSNSFSEGGIYNDLELALKRCQELWEQGADIIDIGAQATSYGALQEGQEKEWQQLAPFLNSLGNLKRISIDSYHYPTIKQALELGVGFINDVSGGKDEKILDAIANHPQVKYICMFSLCLPADKKVRIKDVSEVYAWCEHRVKKLASYNIKPEQIVLDPGIGFSTNPEQSYQIIKHCELLKAYGVEVMVGHSRKSFFEEITSLPPAERDLETVVASLYMYGKVDYLRVHNVAMHKRAFKAWQALV